MTTDQNLQDLTQRISNECKALRTLLNNNAADLSGANTTVKTNFVAIINELKADIDALVGSSGAVINDATTSTSSTWSSQEISDNIAAAVSALIDGAPGALDTLNELAAALNDNASFSSTVTTALANRLQFDAAQTLTAPQKVQGNANLGSVSVAEFGSRTTDYVAIFEAGLV